ncbi:hypothetical protein C2845_PM04G10440 [Panicum miliaceum]|uniref:DUF1618 domain-containing protein n=1 Tax=Panicum miliaceum TaxID=4540 RepID=A0A3L6QSB6_PANMI|nr:hypothetical protein C2845_PM04G10440 [Panicum miliaceum]
MGFVNLHPGILLCDLLLVTDSHRLGYIRLPPPLRSDASLRGDPRLSLAIAVVRDRINYVKQAAASLEALPNNLQELLHPRWLHGRRMEQAGY